MASAAERISHNSKKDFSFSRRDFFKIAIPTVLGATGGMLVKDHIFSPEINPWETDMPEPNPHAKRFLLLGDIHAGDRDINVRQANSKSVDSLKDVTGHLQNYPFDQLIQMGDLIDNQWSEPRNISVYETCLQIMRQLTFPSLHLLGNHDVWGISKENLTRIFQKHRLNNFYGIQEFNDFQIAWLDITAENSMPGTIPEERIDWLRKIIYKDTPTIIVSHYGFLPQNVEGNYYFDGNHQLTAFTNGKKAWKGLKDLPIPLIVNAHLHIGAHTHIDKTHMVTIPAFVENITSSKSHENPGIYSILEIVSPEQFTVKSYFGSVCFMNIQIGPQF